MTESILTGQTGTMDDLSEDHLYWSERLNGDWEMGSYKSDTYDSGMPNVFASCKMPVEEKIYTDLMRKSRNSLHGLFTFCTAAVSIVLYKAGAERDIVLGSPIFKQRQKGGYTNNILPLIISVDPASRCDTFVSRIWDEISAANYHIKYPIEDVLGRRVEGNVSVFQLILEMEEIHQPIDHSDRLSPLYLCFGKENGSLYIEAKYHMRYYLEPQMVRLLSLINIALKDMSLNTQKQVMDVNIIADLEKEALMRFSVPTLPQQLQGTVLHRFIETVNLYPGKLAVKSNEMCLTYTELNTRSNQFARWLQEEGVQQGNVIGILLERSLDWLIAVLGVLKVGGICLPLDASNPRDHHLYVLRDSGASNVILNAGTSLDNHLPCKGIQFQRSRLFDYDESDVMAGLDQHTVAYMIYTSGSTGRPKGVFLQHAGILNHLCAKINELGLSSADTMLHSMNLSFVASIWQLLAPISVGATVILCAQEEMTDAWRQFQIAQCEGVTVMTLVPAMLNAYLMFVEVHTNDFQLQHLRYLVLTGEQLQPELINRFYRHYPEVSLINAYGQSECSDDTLHYLIPYNVNTTVIPIGKPIQNMECFVLDNNQRLQPIGMAGELYISGIGVTAGYHNMPELTQQRFVEHIISPGKIMFRTGDIVRWLPDGNVEYLGRGDRLIKLRGYRIEPGEIEKAIVNSGFVSQAAVLCVGEKTEDMDLCAFVVSPKEDVALLLKEYLFKILPSHMVPSRIICLESMPCSPNGKTDWSCLKIKAEQIEKMPHLMRGSIVLGNELEKELVKAWCEVLKTDFVNIHENFFLSGGNSIKAINLMIKLKTMGIEIKVNDIYNHPTIEQLAAFVAGEAINTAERDNCAGEVILETSAALDTAHGRILSGIEPFRDLFFKNCFYHSLFPVLQSYGIPYDRILVNDMIYYKWVEHTVDVMEYDPAVNIEDLIRGLPLNVEVFHSSTDIVNNIRCSIDEEKLSIVWIDCFYNSLTRNQYQTTHHPHSLLVYGYDDQSELFHVIEHTDLEALNYSSRVISYEQLAEAYKGFLQEFPGNVAPTLYLFSKKEAAQPAISNLQVFQENFLNNESKFQSGLASLERFHLYFLDKRKPPAKEGQELLLRQLNSIINGKKVENYRNKQIFTVQGPRLITEAVIEQWTYLRILIIKQMHSNSDWEATMEFSAEIMRNIIQMEKTYVQMLKLSMHLEKM